MPQQTTMQQVKSCCQRVTPTELFWLLKALITSPQEASQERTMAAFEQDTWPMLKTGGVFSLVDPGDVDVDSGGSGGTLSLGSIKQQVNKLIMNNQQTSATRLPVKPYQILVKLVRATPSAKQTYLEWTTLELDHNKPKFTGRVPLYQVQTIKERNGGMVFFTAQGKVLFEAKSLTEQASIEAGKWVKAWEAAMGALAAQIEDEAALVNGYTQRAQRIEKLEQKRKATEEQRAKLGVVTMQHTARIMAERAGSSSTGSW
jgi:hypothetical protein